MDCTHKLRHWHKVGFTANGEPVSQKRKGRREYTAEFKAKAVARMQHCESVVGLAKELGICWSLLYRWREALQRPAVQPAILPDTKREQELTTLKLALAQKTLEVDFFKGALQKVESLRQQRGGTAFTAKSGK